jgi:hypothetical protein
VQIEPTLHYNTITHKLYYYALFNASKAPRQHTNTIQAFILIHTVLQTIQTHQQSTAALGQQTIRLQRKTTYIHFNTPQRIIQQLLLQ